ARASQGRQSLSLFEPRRTRIGHVTPFLHGCSSGKSSTLDRDVGIKATISNNGMCHPHRQRSGQRVLVEIERTLRRNSLANGSSGNSREDRRRAVDAPPRRFFLRDLFATGERDTICTSVPVPNDHVRASRGIPRRRPVRGGVKASNRILESKL